MCCIRHARKMRCFNPRARGGRDCITITHSRAIAVSIHAPAGGATHYDHSFPRDRSFNPRARGGRDGWARGGADPHYGFQSTRPRGARRTESPRPPKDLCFNPRARGGRDLGFPRVLGNNHRFNPRARGGRDIRNISFVVRAIRFNPRARGGRDLGFPRVLGNNHRFNPRARGGRDIRNISFVVRAIRFNPRARGGRDQGCRIRW